MSATVRHGFLPGGRGASLAPVTATPPSWPSCAYPQARTTFTPVLGASLPASTPQIWVGLIPHRWLLGAFPPPYSGQKMPRKAVIRDDCWALGHTRPARNRRIRLSRVYGRDGGELRRRDRVQGSGREDPVLERCGDRVVRLHGGSGHRPAGRHRHC